MLSYVFRLDSKEVLVYIGATMACFRIIEEEQQAAQRNGHFFNRQDCTNSYFTVHFKNVQHSSKNARE